MRSGGAPVNDDDAGSLIIKQRRCTAMFRLHLARAGLCMEL